MSAKVNRRFNHDWLKEPWAKGWLQEIGSDDPRQQQAYCIYCQSTLRIHYADLKKHASTKVHEKNAKLKVIPKKQTIKAYFTPTLLIKDEKKRDLKLAMFILCHTSINTVDHLGTLLSNTDGSFANLRLHRTKCSCLIQEVISPSIHKEIVEAVGNQRYSIILDESTDVAVNKYLAVIIRYFNGTFVVNDFLGLIEVERATAVDLHKSLQDFFRNINLPINNMLAMSTNGGTNLCGKNHSVYTLLKTDIPDLILLKCVCHSVHLCVSKASEELPSSLDFLSHEIYNWFSNSPLRKINYQKIFDLINIGEDKTFKKFVQLSNTRWLCRYNVIKRIIENWLELRTFFAMAGNDEKCYKARTILEMLQDDKVFMYLKFLLPVLQDTNNLNLLFQSNKCDIGSAYLQYFLTLESFARRIIKPTFLNVNRTDSNRDERSLQNIINCADNPLSYLSLDSCDLGYDFILELENNKTIEQHEMQEIKQRCFNFMKNLLRQFINRLPSNLHSFKNMRLLSPSNCLNEQKSYGFGDLPIVPYILPTEDTNLIENQWRKLVLVKWKDEFSGQKVPDNLLDFWPIVFNYKDGAGHQIFKELAVVVLRMLSLPTSNAAVERAFSIMNTVKTKIRNRMNLKMLQAIMRIKIYNTARNTCCLNFNPSESMLQLFNSNIYNANDDAKEFDLALEVTM